jgi:hypothetical protein
MQTPEVHIVCHVEVTFVIRNPQSVFPIPVGSATCILRARIYAD